MSMRKLISPEVRNRLADDPYMLICVLSSEECEGGLQWHHGSESRGQSYRQDDWRTIIPLCEFHHEHVSRPALATRVREIISQRKLMNPL